MGKERTPNDEDDVSYARGMGCVLGMYSEPIKCWIDESTHTQWLRLCNAKNTTSSELLRDMVYLLVHGKTPAELTAEDRRELFGSGGPTAVLERIGGGRA